MMFLEQLLEFFFLPGAAAGILGHLKARHGNAAGIGGLARRITGCAPS